MSFAYANPEIKFVLSTEVDTIVEQAVKEHGRRCVRAIDSLTFGRDTQQTPLLPESVERQTETPQHELEFAVSTPEGKVMFQRGATGPFFVADDAEDMIVNDQFTMGPPGKGIIRVFTFKALGVAGLSESAFFGPSGEKYVRRFGLMRCFHGNALCVREMYTDQSPGPRIRVAMTPISMRQAHYIFVIGNIRPSGLGLFGEQVSVRESDDRENDKLPEDGLVALRVI